jgi:hypothetical protein
VAYDNNKSFDEKRNAESIFSKRIKAGKRRTYFFDVRETRGSDYFITITESKKRFNDDGYDRHKMFIYKEDFNKFLTALTETVDYVKTDLMPDFDFDAFNHDDNEEGREYSSESSYTPSNSETTINTTVAEPVSIASTEEDDDTGMDAWKI